VFIILLTTGCFSAKEDRVNTDHGTLPDRYAALQSVSITPSVEEIILNLDPDSISGKDIAEVLSKSPAPHIINLNGSVPIITMEPFSKFLISMGYPEENVRNPENGKYYYSSYESSDKLAGKIAWHYERKGMMPILIGHSQGGMIVIKVLHELEGAFNHELHVVNPVTGAKEGRQTIIDPLTGLERPVAKLKIGFSAAIATGKFMRVLLGQWRMIPLLRKIPDAAVEFTGYHIPFDILGGNFLSSDAGIKYYASGSAAVRNVVLPPDYKHISIPETEHLAKDKQIRDWINNYNPSGEQVDLEWPADTDTRNIMFAADIWYSIKKNWCIQLQQLISAKRSSLSSAS
jgi:hypothetical protein